MAVCPAHDVQTRYRHAHRIQTLGRIRHHVADAHRSQRRHQCFFFYFHLLSFLGVMCARPNSNTSLRGYCSSPPSDGVLPYRADSRCNIVMIPFVPTCQRTIAAFPRPAWRLSCAGVWIRLPHCHVSAAHPVLCHCSFRYSMTALAFFRVRLYASSLL